MQASEAKQRHHEQTHRVIHIPEAERRRASQAVQAARQNLCGADMSLASKAWQESALGLALALLNKHRSAPQEPDLPGWE
jgi:hypothetical protein